MMADEPKKMPRREALVVLGRMGALAGIVGGIGWLAARNARGCELENPCQACAKYRNCDLDKARAARVEAAR
jgi:hypothetical protein